jgi:hypothetical protein
MVADHVAFTAHNISAKVEVYGLGVLGVDGKQWN